jgi:flagella basal body P-ring formation protein FlgA
MKMGSAAFILCLLSLTLPAAGSKKTALLIYLPREVSVEAGVIRLGSISVIRSKDAELTHRAQAVSLGRSPWPKEQVVIDHRTILSRLACCGVASADVRITGAPKVTVTGKHKVIGPEKIRRCAESYLKSHPPKPPGCKWRLVRMPKEMTLSVAQEVSLQAQLAKDAPRNHVKVRVAAKAGEREIAAADVLFQLAYRTWQAVTTKQVLPGQKITPENVKLESVVTTTPPEGNWSPPYGLIAARRMPPGSAIRPGLVRAPAPAVAIRRRQNVVMKIEGPGFTITGLGQALQDGRPGEFIKVRNIDSKRTIVAEVASDGTVKPVFEGKER